MIVPKPQLISSIFACQTLVDLPDGTASAIYKTPLNGLVCVDSSGLVNDRQADRSVHGGIDKALHQFPAAHYARLSAQFPSAAEAMVVGSIGENLASSPATEAEVCIGDVYALGSARLKLSLPRRPCWKIDQRYATQGVAAWIVEQGCTGWYYQVIERGQFAAGAELALLDRPRNAPSVLEVHQTLRLPRPAPGQLERLAKITALPESLRAKITQRLNWLKRHS